MKNRRDISAADEGEPKVRPLSALWRIALGILVACLLAIAIQDTMPGDQDDVQAISHEYNDDGVRQIDWDSLPETIVAWVEVPGTNIDEPIAQASPSYPNQYLYVDALGQGAYGTPYIDCDCTVDSTFVIVYGHHMSDGTVFAEFASFIDRGFAEAHATIYVYTRYDNSHHELKVKAIDVVNAYTERIRTDFTSDEDRIAYLNEILGKCDLVIQDEKISDEKVWVFATCSYQTSNSRTVVYATDSGNIDFM